MNIPENLTQLINLVTNRIDDEELRNDFTNRVAQEIGNDDRDLSKVVWIFLGDVLDNLPETAPAIKELILPVRNDLTFLVSGYGLNDGHAERARDDAQEFVIKDTDYANIAVLVAEEILEPGKGNAVAAANLAAFLHGFVHVPTLLNKGVEDGIIDEFFESGRRSEFVRQEKALFDLLSKA